MKGKITLIQILLIFVVVICGVTYYSNVSDKSREQTKLESIIEEAPEAVPDTGQEPDAAAPAETDTAEETVARIKELYEANPDTVGWIKIPDTAIDYPVLHNAQSNAYYLHRNFDREYSSAGIPFLDYQCKRDGTSDNTIIYGHNMRNGTMFNNLLKYKDKAFYSEHKNITYTTQEGAGKYEIFAVIHSKVGAKNEFRYYELVEAQTPADFDKFIAECIKRSLYKTNIIPQYGDKIITLSTCSYNTDNERFVVFGRKIK